MTRAPFFVIGKTHGRLTMLKKLPGYRALCLCTCGVRKQVSLNQMQQGKTMSCGCLARELQSSRASVRNRKHGMFGTRVYAIWNSMLDRCTNPNHHAFHRYGGRGIGACKRWAKFENFYADMGEPNGLTLERRNNNRGYMPSNCYWATTKEQGNNKSTNVQLTYKGRTQTISQWADELGIARGLITDRVRRYGWTVKRAFETPKRAW